MKTGGGADVLHSGGNAFIVESHPVDNGLLGNQAEQAGFVIARLRPRRQRAYFHKAEPGLAEGVHRIRLLVHSGGETHTVGEFHPQDFHGVGRNLPHQKGQYAHLFCQAQPPQGHFVGGFRIHLEQYTFSGGI